MTKAKQVREMIAQAKQQGAAADTLFIPVMEKFGFARQLARAYVLNNWSKVEVAMAEQRAAEAVEQPAAAVEQPAAAVEQPAAAVDKLAERRARDAARKRERRAAERAAREAAAAVAE